MSDYSHSAVFAPIGTVGLLALCLVVIGVVFIYMSLGQKQDPLNHTHTSTKVMHRWLFWSGIVLMISGFLAVVMV